MNRGYAGFYKGHYLRSSYEYAYAKYLDYHSIPWSHEDSTFDLGYKLYKPDFFIYDQYGNLIKIIEIKSRNKEAKIEAKRALDIIIERYNVECELISYEELLKLYESLPFSLTSTITEWIVSNNTTIHKAANGKLNGHFNLKHGKNTKKIIGEHTRKLWASDSPARRKMLEGLKKSGMKKGYIKVPREIRICTECVKEFKVLVTSPQKFCSQSCAGKVAIRNATARYMDKRKSIRNSLKDYIVKWSIDNKEIVLETPLNKIKPTMEPLVINIQKQFGVKDFRVISGAVFGEDRGRKELIRFMKECVMKSYAELTENEPLEPEDKKPLG
ncbi:restriction endonuclease [Neobacillus sp. YIM B06451]|uniref:restriction endonuclease n=1 Tax=Neobacillus sp. YIM B06451 TaxID=3070994 RepID=UPI00292E0C28|nr:restriction endonuclease [Neobacillus sp. YIM B06451]